MLAKTAPLTYPNGDDIFGCDEAIWPPGHKFMGSFARPNTPAVSKPSRVEIHKFMGSFFTF